MVVIGCCAGGYAYRKRKRNKQDERASDITKRKTVEGINGASEPTAIMRISNERTKRHQPPAPPTDGTPSAAGSDGVFIVESSSGEQVVISCRDTIVSDGRGSNGRASNGRDGSSGTAAPPLQGGHMRMAAGGSSPEHRTLALGSCPAAAGAPAAGTALSLQRKFGSGTAGSGTLDPEKVNSWKQRRANIQRGLSAEGVTVDIEEGAGVCVESPRGPETSSPTNSMDLPGVAASVAAAAASAATRPGSRPGSATAKDVDLQSRSNSGAKHARPSPSRGRSGLLSKLTASGSKLSAKITGRRSSTPMVEVDAPAAPPPLNPQAEKICEEVRQTEAAYITDMNVVLTAYVRPAQQQKVLTMEDSQAIFANLEELSRCASVLLELMDRPGDSVSVLAGAFIKVTPFFKLYAFYCRNYERALETLGRCQKTVPGFQDFLIRQQALPECRGLQLQSYLIKPVQRLTKYPLFWKDILKNTPHTHPDRALLEKADSLVRTVSMAVNQNLNDEIARLKTVDLLASLGNDYLELIAPHRKLTLEFTCTVHVGLRPMQMVGYVVTDLIILCTTGRGGRSDRKTPWLLSQLHQVVLNQPVNLEAISLHSAGVDAERSEARFGLQPPVGVPQSRLVNLRVPPDEEMWLEMADESMAYDICDRLTNLGEISARQFPGSASPRSNMVDILADKLQDKRLAKVGGSRRVGGARPSRRSNRDSESRSTDESARGKDSTRGTGRESSASSMRGGPAAADAFGTPERAAPRVSRFSLKAFRRSLE